MDNHFLQWRIALESGTAQEFNEANIQINKEIADMNDNISLLSQSLDVAEANPEKFNIAHDQLLERRSFSRSVEQFVEQISKEIHGARAEQRSAVINRNVYILYKKTK